MAFLHRSQFSWFLALGFIILLTLKLDGRIDDWNWFIIFIPMWVFDSVVWVYILIKMIMQCRNKQWRNGYDTTMKMKMCWMAGILLKLLFQILLCLRLQYIHGMSLYYLMLPVWLLNFACVVKVFENLRSLAKKA